VPSNADENVAVPAGIDLAGRRVLITGASSGIGAAMARAFAARGASVAVHYHRNQEAAQSIVDEIRAMGGRGAALQADLTQPAAARRLVDEAANRLEGLDTLVNNAGGPVALRRVAEMTDTHFDQVFNLNARSVLDACQSSIPHLRRAAPDAAVINVTSLSARLGGSVGAGLYAASKAFVVALTKNLARELAPDGIRVNAISPGYVDTPLHHAISSPELISSWLTQIPLGRAGRAEDCVGAALFLASSSLSGFVTGQVLEVNGGQFTGG
jgi:3-oxoacyl-[acyl-carrier protein] reductase